MGRVGCNRPKQAVRTPCHPMMIMQAILMVLEAQRSNNWKRLLETWASKFKTNTFVHTYFKSHLDRWLKCGGPSKPSIPSELQTVNRVLQNVRSRTECDQLYPGDVHQPLPVSQWKQLTIECETIINGWKDGTDGSNNITIVSTDKCGLGLATTNPVPANHVVKGWVIPDIGGDGYQVASKCGIFAAIGPAMMINRGCSRHANARMSLIRNTHGSRMNKMHQIRSWNVRTTKRISSPNTELLMQYGRMGYNLPCPRCSI